MNDQKVLLTGDFWHADFKSVISSIDVPLTLASLDKIESVSDSKFDLVVIAQSRRDQIQLVDVEKLQSIFANTPIVGLLGSWCEGEMRSGTPWPGITRIYWHQWRGRFDAFKTQLTESSITDWHSPSTATPADRIAIPKPKFLKAKPERNIGLSAWTQTRHAMLADAIQSFGWNSCWVERANLEEQSPTDLSAICVDGDSWTEEMIQRVTWLKGKAPNTPIVVALNYPRATDLQEIEDLGVSEVISKPFELVELQSAIERSVDQVGKKVL